MFPITLSPEFISALQFVLFFLALYLAVFSLSLAIWAFQDSRRRSRNWLVHFLAAALVLTFNLPGLIIYLLIRPGETLAQQYERSLEEAALMQDLEKQLACPRCKKAVQQDFIICPHCTEPLRRACRSCGAALSAIWKACPYCTALVALPGAEPAPAPALDVVREAPPPTPRLPEAVS